MKKACRVTLVSTLAAVLGVWSGATPSLAAAAEPTHSALVLRWQVQVQYDGEYNGEYLIYRDGLVVWKGGPAGPTILYARGAAAAAALADLRDVLSANRVGQVHANGCRGFDWLPTGGSYDAVLTWFGNGRQNRLVIETAGEEFCSAEVDAIIAGVTHFVSNVPYGTAVETLP